MGNVKKLRTYAFLFMGMIFLTSAIAMSSGKIRIFDFKYEKFEFLNGEVVLELPDKSSNPTYGMYYKILMDKALSWEAGHFEVSIVNINKYKGPNKEESKNQLLIEIQNRFDTDGLDISRTAIWYGENPIVVRVKTSVTKNTFPTASEREACIHKDDEIFEHVVESFRYRKVDGTYAAPEIVRQGKS